MNGNDNKGVINIVEECLQRLEAGQTVEYILDSFPEYAGELRPLLETARTARRFALEETIPLSAQIRSRTRFLAEAALIRPAHTQPISLFSVITWRLAAIPLLVTLIVITSLLGIGLSSVKALPGDTFYGIKVAIEQTRLNLATTANSRLSLEESFDKNRIGEVVILLEQKRTQPVDFGGFLNQVSENSWQVGGIPVVFDPSANIPLNDLVGTYVDVKGITAKDQVKVKNIELRLFHLSGVIENLKPNLWKVNGVPVTIEPNTYIQGKPSVGSQVDITAVRPQTDRLQAILARISATTGTSPAK